MPFKKNHKLGKGRPLNSKNKKTHQWEEIGNYIRDKGADKLIEELSELKGKVYVQAFTSIIEYFKPKLSRKDVDLTSGGSVIDFFGKSADKLKNE